MMARKAVIAAAGYGSRFFPVAKTINKCMLPILNRPVIEYTVEACTKAGISQIAIVGPPGDTQIQRYFTEDLGMEWHFRERGWDRKYEAVEYLHDLADFVFLEQPRDGRYGTAIPAMIAADFVGGDDFLLLSGDDLLLREDGGSDIADLVQARESAGVPGAIAAVAVPGERARNYGVLTTEQRQDLVLLNGILEKPSDYTDPAALVNISRAVVPCGFLSYLDGLQPSDRSGEYQLTEAVELFATDHDLLVHVVKGAYHDCGDPASWLAANVEAARMRGLHWRSR
jgi:UTP--glucose-1-phosphate uridylyltransferase